MFKAASETAALIKRSPHESNMIDSPFYTRFGASMYEYYEENPRKGTRFATAMSSWSQCESYFLSDIAHTTLPRSQDKILTLNTQ